MPIENMVHDLNVYFQGRVKMKPVLGGWVNPSYLELEYQGRRRVLPFWGGATGEAEKRLAVALRDDIQAFIQEKPHVEQERVQESGIPEHQDRDGGGQASEASGGDRPVGPAPSKRRGRPKKEVTNLQHVK